MSRAWPARRLWCALTGAAATLLVTATAAGAQPPAAVLAYYDDLRPLVSSLTAVPLPPTVPLYYGNYYGSPRVPGKTPRPKPPAPPVPAGRLAPILSLIPGTFWERRRLTPAEIQQAQPSLDDPVAGRMPRLRSILRGSPASRLRWGQELGRRFRDRVRAEIRKGKPIVAWQFDEVPGEAGALHARPLRDFIRGVLQGLVYGRALLGDQPQRGIIWVTRSAVPDPKKRLSPELARFWTTVDQASFLVVGEEYVPFVGRPEQAAHHSADLQRALLRGDSLLRPLALKYVVGSTPGFVPSPGLGGNVKHKPVWWVNRWREAFMRARARNGVAGFAEWNFRSENRRPSVVGGVVRGLASALGAIESLRAGGAPAGA